MKMTKILALVLAVLMVVGMLAACGNSGSKKNAEYIHYSRAGYGKLGFRADFGPAQFTAVRQAIAYCMDRDSFAKAFTGGYGGVVDGPYYTGAWFYKQAIANGMQLNTYETSQDKAIATLVADGWVYDKDGNDYQTGVRYKKIADADIKAADKTYQSKDGAYKCAKVGDYWYMPLVLNWYGSENNEFTDLLVTDFMNNAKIAAIGMVVQNTIGTFSALLGELHQYNGGGYSYGGTPMYSCFNFATSFTSAAYDYSYNCTIDPAMFEDYSQWYVKDAADYLVLTDKSAIADGTYINFDGKEYKKDYTSIYEQWGKGAKVSDVKTDADGNATLTFEGKSYILGLDFLTMAMVYNATTEAEYVAWWQYFMQRWNKLLPEVPLYCNEYYDLYSTKLSGVAEHPTNPYWGAERAVIDWKSADDKFIMGSTTELSGMFRYASFGVSSPAASNSNVATLTQGLDTVVTTKEGGYAWNDTVVKSHTAVENADGSKTYTIEIYDDLKYSDGSAVTARDYLISTLVFSSEVATQASGRNAKSGMTIVGYDEFAAYNGDNAGEEGVSKVFSGLRLLGDYKFSVTISPDHLPYYYDIAYAAFGPSYKDLWLGDADLKDDGEGCYLTDAFYAGTTATKEETKKDEEGNETTVTVEYKKYTMADHIKASAANTDTTYPYSGAYVVKSYDASAKEATLELNPYFKGNYEGTKPQIKTVVYKLLVSATQMDDFKAGGVDFIAGITGGNETNEAIAYADGTAE